MESSKQFLTGLSPSPPSGHIWQEHSGYGIYLADQHRSVWRKHSHNCTQVTVALDPAFVHAEWQDSAGLAGERELTGDMVWIVPPGVSHSVDFNRRASLIHLYLSDQFFERSTNNQAMDVSRKLSPSFLVRDSFLVEMAKELYAELQFGPVSKLFSQSIATITANHLIRSYSSRCNVIESNRTGLGAMREQRVRQYIQLHLHTQISLEQLALVAEMSPSHFATLFHQSTGITPHRFVVRQRVELAKSLLEHSMLPLADIALRCGFQDQSQFTAVFKRHLGLPPGRYRRDRAI
jgi:AraC family transcriptional regulator